MVGLNRGLIKKMFGKQLIAALAALIFILGGSIAIGMCVDDPSTNNGFSDNSTFGAKKQASIILAQNEKTASGDSEKSPSGSETSESGAAADDEKKSSEAESKPLAPFVPSEKIPGDQEVDFPVDI